MEIYVALLRGINVGGKNLIKMSELAAFFRAMGFTGVQTYIQSGNVVFCSSEPDPMRLTGLLEESLSQSFNYKSTVVLRSYDQMKRIVKKAPKAFGSQPEVLRYDVVYLRDPLTPQEALSQLTPRKGVDQAWARNEVLYFTRLIAKASQSRLTRLISLPIYPNVTIRNWNTTTKLLSLMEEFSAR